MKVTRFDPNSDLIIVKARIWGPGGKTPASLAVDTGSAHTVRGNVVRILLRATADANADRGQGDPASFN